MGKTAKSSTTKKTVKAKSSDGTSARKPRAAASKTGVARAAAKPKRVAKPKDDDISIVDIVDAPETRKRPARKAKPVDEHEANRTAARQAAQFALEKKAINVRMLDLTGITSMTDFFVIASGDSDRQVKAIAENVISEMRDTVGIAPWRSEGWDGLKWVLIDFVDFVVHIFQSESRQYYNLERLWADAPSEEIADKPAKATRGKKKPAQRDDSQEEETNRTTDSGVRVISDFQEVKGR